MGNNTSMTGDQMKKLGFVEDGAGTGNFVHISKLTPKGKVDKLPNLIERAITPDKILIDKSGPAFNNVLLQARINELNAQEAFDGSNFKNSHIDEYGLMERISAKDLFKVYKETGYMFAKLHTYETFLLPDGSYIDVLYSFDLSPVSAPRMTQSDKWKLDPNHIDPLKRQRKPVEKYFKFKQDLLSLCAVNGYNLTERLNILFVVPMPDSWSKNKRYAMNNQPHKQRPDRDNYLKAFQDSFKGDDGHVWDGRTIKVWGAKGRIIIF